MRRFGLPLAVSVLVVSSLAGAARAATPKKKAATHVAAPIASSSETDKLNGDFKSGKSFRDFGQLMQGRFGKAREIFVDEKSKAGVTHKLDHFIWNSKGGDVLRLVDRSGFYDVYCLAIADGSQADKQAEAAKAHAKA